MADQVDLARAARRQPLVNSKTLSDVTFAVGRAGTGTLIYGHRFPLALLSDVFFRMFTSELTSSDNPHVEVPDIEPEVFLEMLNSIYYDQQTITQDNVVKLFYAAEKYNLGDLKSRCLLFISREEDSALRIFKANMEFNFKQINESCLSVICGNPLKFFKSSDFFELPLELVSKIADQSKLRCNYDQLMQAMHKWTEHQKDKDTENIHEMLNKLKAIVYKKQECVTYNHCKKLMFLGSFKVYRNTHLSEIELELTALKPFDLYGIGLYIGGYFHCDNAISAKISGSIICGGQTLVQICADNVPIIKNNIYVYDCMFERCSLQAKSVVMLKCTTQYINNKSNQPLESKSAIGFINPDNFPYLQENSVMKFSFSYSSVVKINIASILYHAEPSDESS